MMAALSFVGRAAALGAAAGMRTLSAPAALSRRLASGGGEPDGELERLLAHPAAPWVLGIASAAEHVADKLPSTPDRTDAMRVLSRAGATVTSNGADVLEITGLDVERVAALMAQSGLRLRELTPHRASLEDAFMELTRDAVEFEARQ